MTLATVEPDGRPSARMVICRGFDAQAGWFVFYTDHESAKGQALAAHPYTSLVFHWDAFERQIRVDGRVTPAPDADSDAYWATRPHDARLPVGRVPRRRLARAAPPAVSSPALASR